MRVRVFPKLKIFFEVVEKPILKDVLVSSEVALPMRFLRRVSAQIMTSLTSASA